MDLFHPTRDKGKAMTHVVSFHGIVPLERGLCYALYLVDKHHSFSPDRVLSAARDVTHIAEHNKTFHTRLHAQQWLIDAHARDPRHFAPANPVNQTSHCLHSDGNPAYRTAGGQRIWATGRLLWYQRGIDLFDPDFAAWFIRVAATVNMRFTQPYKTTAEAHHVVCTRSPIDELVRRSVIHKR